MYAEDVNETEISSEQKSDQEQNQTDQEDIIHFESEETKIIAVPDNPPKKQIITRDQIEKSNSQDITELLEKTAGLSVTRYGAYGNNASIKIRGFDNSRVLCLINGVPVNSAQSGTFNINMLPVNMVKQIEIISGGSDSGKNHSGVVGGAINIITHQKEKPSFMLQQSISNLFYYPGYYYTKPGKKQRNFTQWPDLFDTQRINTAFRINNDIVSWNIGLSGTKAGNHFIYKDDNEITRRKIHNEVWDGNLNTSLCFYLPGYTSLTFSGDYYYGHKSMPGPVNSTNIGIQQDHFVNSGVFLDSDYFISERIDMEFHANYKYHHLDWQEVYLQNRHQLNTVQFLNKWGVYLEEWVSLIFGGDLVFDWLDSNNMGRINLINGGGYFTADFFILSRVKIIPTLKIAYYKDYPLILPKCGFLFYLSDHFILKNNYYRVFKNPTINDLYWPEDNYAKGNPELKPEDGVGGDIILTYQKQGFFLTENSLFVNYLKDAILWHPGPDNIWYPQNIGQAFYFGFEHKMISDFNPYVKFRLNYTFLLTYVLNGELTFEDNIRMPYQPLHTFSLGIDFTWISGNVNLSGRFESEKYLSLSNAYELPSFFFLDINFSQNISMFTVFVSWKNVFNQLYYLIDDYPVPGGSITMGVRFTFQREFKNKDEVEFNNIF